MSLHINRPPQIYGRAIIYCPVCERRRRFALHFMGAYYGTRGICTHCGDEWMDGEMLERPFKPRWRKDSVARARKMWEIALNKSEYREAVRAEIREALS